MTVRFVSQHLPLLLLLAVLMPGRAFAQSNSPSADFPATFAAVDSLRSHGEFEAALDRLNQLPPSDEYQVEVLWRQALMLSDWGRRDRDSAPADTTRARHKRALALANSALARDSTSAWAHLAKALSAGRLTLHTNGSTRIKYSRAVKHHTDRAIDLDSTLAPAYHLRGRWCREVADLNFFKRAIVKTIYGGLPDASLAQAVRDLERATALESASYNHLQLAKTYLEMDRDSAARRELRRALHTSGSPFDAEHKEEARALLQTNEE